MDAEKVEQLELEFDDEWYINQAIQLYASGRLLDLIEEDLLEEKDNDD